MYEEFGINNELERLSKKVEEELKGQFEEIDKICEINSIKVLKAFQDCGLSETHFNSEIKLNRSMLKFSKQKMH